jgi:endonuclease/exonuclease/phosphatase family metal-dependent hydrolase
MTWNVEWFQDPSEGPTDDALQFARVLEVLRRTDSDLIALQEVCSPEAFARLDEALPRHAGVLAEYRWTQKLGLLYDASRLTVTSVTAIEGLDDAGRPPLDVSFELGPERRPLRVVVVHAKASGDPESRATRARFATGLAARLTPSESPTLIMGDFNDTLGASLTAGEAPPYAPLSNAGLVDLTAALEAPTASERSAGIGTLDHVVASAELATRVRPGSVDVLQRELLAHYPDFRSTVSDHFPVVVALDP